MVLKGSPCSSLSGPLLWVGDQALRAWRDKRRGPLGHDLGPHSPTGHTVAVPFRVHKEVALVDGDHLLRSLLHRPVILAQHHLIGQRAPVGGSQVGPGLWPIGSSPSSTHIPAGQVSPETRAGRARGPVTELTRCSGLQSGPSWGQRGCHRRCDGRPHSSHTARRPGGQ